MNSSNLTPSTSASPSQDLELSIVVPIYNEKENIQPFFEELKSVLDGYKKSYEIIFIDDGSADGSTELLEELAKQHPAVKVVVFRRNFGQTAAMAAGFELAKGEVVIPIDGDGQNDPGEIPRLVNKLKEEKLDVVSGWRKNRQDKFFRSFLSRIANRIISYVSGTHLHDYGCTLKAYRREILQDVRLYGEMHRLIPIFVSWAGGKVAELPVNHRPRQRGKSKYGFGRIFKVMIDLITAKFLSTYLEKPAYVFGFVGFLVAFGSILTLAFVVWRRIFWHGQWISPLLFIGVGGIGLSILFVLMGLLSELMVRIYFESQGKKPYIIKKIL
ncbi:MAG: glycosyltransferase [Planctomycetota bacterium]|nr:MAG: glycosyltransferase [Planctomycetota bacterium]